MLLSPRSMGQKCLRPRTDRLQDGTDGPTAVCQMDTLQSRLLQLSLWSKEDLSGRTGPETFKVWSSLSGRRKGLVVVGLLLGGCRTGGEEQRRRLRPPLRQASAPCSSLRLQ